jgi:hypothetical protein
MGPKSWLTIVLLFVFIFGLAGSGQPASASGGIYPPPGLSIATGRPGASSISSASVTTAEGTEVVKHKINAPSKPPRGYETERRAVTAPGPNVALGSKSLDVPAYKWSFGAAATSAAMIAAYYDRNGFPNVYTGPENGSVMPMDDSAWLGWTDSAGAFYSQNPLTASHNGLDGRILPGSIDDYWVSKQSGMSDPYIRSGWQQHAWGDAIGDYMKTSQSAYGNIDGETTFNNYRLDSPNVASKFLCSDLVYFSLSEYDGTYGRKLFYEARAYTVDDCYNQNTDNRVDGGFSFAQYQAEIDAGHPVMLNLDGHTVAGTGYNDTNRTIYIHDTWDYLTHSMTWGGSYAGMPLMSVSIVHPGSEGDSYLIFVPITTKQ